MTDLSALVGALPKAELHVHLEGCLEADLLLELARRNDVAVPWSSVEQVRAAHRFDDLAGFPRLYFEGCRVLVQEQDFYDLTRSYLARAHADGVVRVEAFLGPAVVHRPRCTGVRRARRHVARHGRRRARRRHQRGARRERSPPPQRGRRVRAAGAGAAVGRADRGVRGSGGAEVGNPPAKFARWFAELRAQGFPTSAHAGEEGPAQYVREAVEVLQVDRVDHGVRAMDDPALVADLVAAAVPLTVCPVSNVRLGVVRDLASHPLPAMLEAGLTVVLGADDPAYFDAGLGATYAASAQASGLSAARLADLAATSIRTSRLPEPDKARHLATISALLEGPRRS